jgi:hypothetical protein
LLSSSENDWDDRNRKVAVTDRGRPAGSLCTYESPFSGVIKSVRFEGGAPRRPAQHPVIVHFPIALFIVSAVFDILAIWRKEPILAAVGYFNLVAAAITVPLTIATGLARVTGSSKTRRSKAICGCI